MAMALGLGFSSPHAVAGHGGFLPHQGKRRRKLLLVQALGEEETEITSIRDQTLSTVAKRFFNWGRDVHQQATRQMQKFFHELADGSLLVSFGEPPDSETRNSVPPRLPSRYSKQFPYTAKRTKQDCSLPSNGRQLPHRKPSTFSKKSPITNFTSRRSKKDNDGMHLLAFKDVEIEDEAEVIQEHGKKSDMGKDENEEHRAESNRHEETNNVEERKPRPKTAFLRKSPIPETARRRKPGKTAQEPINQNSADVLEKLKQPKLTRPGTAFSRKSPILEPSIRSRKPQTSIGTNADSIDDLEESKLVSPRTTFSQKSPIPEGSKGSGKPSRPTQNEATEDLRSDAEQKAEGSSPHDLVSHRARTKGVFTRKSPIIQGKGGRRKRRSLQSPPTPDDAVTSEQSSVVTEVKLPRRKGSFVRQSPIPSRDGSSRKKRGRKGLALSEEEILHLALDAVKRAEDESLRASEQNVVAEVLVETPTNALSIKLGEEESVLLEVRHEETTSRVLKKQENKEPIEVAEKGEVSTGKEQGTENDIPEKIENIVEGQAMVLQSEIEERVESVETDVEFSEDESVTNSVDESDLSILTLRRLKRIAKSRGLRGYSRLRKAELIELLKES